MVIDGLLYIIPQGGNGAPEPVQRRQCRKVDVQIYIQATHHSPRTHLCASGQVAPQTDMTYSLATWQGDSGFIQVRKWFPMNTASF